MNNTQDMNQQTGVNQTSELKIPAGDRIQQNHISHVWDIIDKARIGMLTTQFNAGMRARPMISGSSSSMKTIAFIFPSPAALS